MQEYPKYQEESGGKRASRLGGVVRVMSLPLLVCMLYACGDEVGPEIPPLETYGLGERMVDVGSADGEVTVALFPTNTFVPFVFLKESSPLSDYNCKLFVNRQEDMSDRFQGLDVKYYCERNGMSEFLDSPETAIPYKWVEVSSFTDTDEEQKLVVRYEENTDPMAREMYIHFYNGQWGVVCIHQSGQKQ